MQKFTPFLMFVGKQNGKAEEAVNLYVSLFKDSKIVELERNGLGTLGPVVGTLKRCRFSLNGQEFMAYDGGLEHNFSFTPAMSIFVECDSEEEIDRLYNSLMEGGQAHMPIGSYGFSKKFGWVADKYGVSWQLNLAK